MWSKKRPLSTILSPIVVFRVKFVCQILCSKKFFRRKNCSRLITCILLISGIFVLTLKLNAKYDELVKIFEYPSTKAKIVDYYELFFVNTTDNTFFTDNNNDSRRVYGGVVVSQKWKTDVAHKICQDISSYLHGRVSVIHPHNVIYVAQDLNKFWTDIISVNEDVQLGGWYKPSECVPEHHVAIIIPFRDRDKHLALLLQQLHGILKRQLIHYQIFVVEQEGSKTFNKARIMNIAYDKINDDANQSFNCFIFHDVDLLPENDKNLYRCGPDPIHLSPSVDTFGYRLPYHELVGGVFAITPEHFERVNGYSNLYWGWGGEDDDMYYRLEQENLNVSRPPVNIGRYKMMRHVKRNNVTDASETNKFKLVWSAKRRYKIDGLRQLQSLNYTIVAFEKKVLYTHLLVDIGTPPPLPTKAPKKYHHFITGTFPPKNATVHKKKS